MDLEHCSNCQGSHPVPPGLRPTLPQEGKPPAQKDPLPVSTAPTQARTRRSPRQRQGGKTAHQRDQTPAAPEVAQNQPDPPQSPDRPTPRDPYLQPSVVLHPADRQAAAIQAIADQLSKMQQDAKAFQAAATRDREAVRQEMLRRTDASQPTPGPSRQESPQPRLPYPPTDFRVPARQPPPYPTQGLSVPPPTQPIRPPGTCLLPDGTRPSRISAHSSLFLPSPSGKSSLGELALIPSICSKQQTLLQLHVQTPTPQSRPISFSEELG